MIKNNFTGTLCIIKYKIPVKLSHRKIPISQYLNLTPLRMIMKPAPLKSRVPMKKCFEKSHRLVKNCILKTDILKKMIFLKNSRSPKRSFFEVHIFEKGIGQKPHTSLKTTSSENNLLFKITIQDRKSTRLNSSHV